MVLARTNDACVEGFSPPHAAPLSLFGRLRDGRQAPDPARNCRGGSAEWGEWPRKTPKRRWMGAGGWWFFCFLFFLVRVLRNLCGRYTMFADSVTEQELVQLDLSAESFSHMDSTVQCKTANSKT